MLEHTLEEAHTARSSRARLEANDAFDRFQVPETPQLEAFIDVDELFRHFVRVPPMLRVVVDQLEDADQLRVLLIRLRPVALDATFRHGQAATREVAQEFV